MPICCHGLFPVGFIRISLITGLKKIVKNFAIVKNLATVSCDGTIKNCKNWTTSKMSGFTVLTV